MAFLNRSLFLNKDGVQNSMSTPRPGAHSGLEVKLGPDPEGCNGGAHYGMHAKLSPGQSNNYDVLASMLMTA